MNAISKFHLFIIFLIITISGNIVAQELSAPLKFEDLEKVPFTTIKNQNRSSTCWSFSVLSMIESEILKSKGDTLDLSVMYVVYWAYIEKAERYIHMHGNIALGGGGALNDPIDIIHKYGIVPKSAYSGIIDGSNYINHSEMDASLKVYLENIVKKKRIPATWKEEYVNLLNSFIGKIPETFDYKGNKYTPLSFAKSLNFKPENYILYSSFCDRPYYEKHIVEVPDNWSWGQAINLPLDEFQKLVDYSIEQGYSVAIASDVSEKGFMWDKGIALADHDPEFEYESPVDPSMWSPRLDTSSVPYQEIAVNPLMRQQAYDHYETNDDHGMQIVGKATDVYKKKYYIVKNSWGTQYTPFNGLLYLSEAYFQYKTLTILVNKNALPYDVVLKLEKIISY
jgi:bleomycin hydrolase